MHTAQGSVSGSIPTMCISGCDKSQATSIDFLGWGHCTAALWAYRTGCGRAWVRTSKESPEKPKEREMRAARACGVPAEPQWMMRCVKITASPLAHGSARTCWNASLHTSAAFRGSGAPSSSGSPTQVHATTEPMPMFACCMRVRQVAGDQNRSAAGRASMHGIIECRHALLKLCQIWAQLSASVSARSCSCWY